MQHRDEDGQNGKNRAERAERRDSYLVLRHRNHIGVNVGNASGDCRVQARRQRGRSGGCDVGCPWRGGRDRNVQGERRGRHLEGKYGQECCLNRIASYGSCDADDRLHVERVVGSGYT